MTKLINEVNKCLLCKKPSCKKSCPINTDIPTIIGLYRDKKIKEAGEILFNNNPLSSICAIVCPHEKQCLGNCIKGIKQEPVKFHKIEEYISTKFLKETKLNINIEKKNKKMQSAGSQTQKSKSKADQSQAECFYYRK